MSSMVVRIIFRERCERDEVSAQQRLLSPRRSSEPSSTYVSVTWVKTPPKRPVIEGLVNRVAPLIADREKRGQ